jgi:hypothetical protein
VGNHRDPGVDHPDQDLLPRELLEVFRCVHETARTNACCAKARQSLKRMSPSRIDLGAMRTFGEDSYSECSVFSRRAIAAPSAHVRASLENKAFAAFMCNENACECGPV